MVVRTDLDVERKKAHAFLAGDPHVRLEERRVSVRPVKETEDVIVSQERKNEKKMIENPRLKTEAYLKQIGKL